MFKIHDDIKKSQPPISLSPTMTLPSFSIQEQHSVLNSEELSPDGVTEAAAADCQKYSQKLTDTALIQQKPAKQKKMGSINDLSEEQCLQYFKTRVGTVKKQSGQEYLACCPFHDDKHPSLSINPVKKQWYCLSECKTGGGMIQFEVKFATGVQNILCSTSEAWKRIAEVLGISKLQSEKELEEGVYSYPCEPEAIYTYTDVFDTVLFEVLRYPGKHFTQRRPDGKSGWIYKTSDIRKVLYHLSDVACAKYVIVCEGEKDTDNLKAALDKDHKHWAITTSPGGAGRWLDEFAAYLAGKQVLIFPDHDDPGRKHALQIALSIYECAHTVKIVELPGQPEKGDISDFLKDHTAADLFALAELTALWKPLASSENAKETLKAKKAAYPNIITLSAVTACEVEWLWKPYLAIGMLAMLSGDPGAGKTFVAQAIAAALTLGHVPSMHQPRAPAHVLYLSVENSPEHVLRPRFDSLGGNPSLFHVVDGPVRLSDISFLSSALQQTKAELMVVDPIQSFLGADVDAHRANETRPVLDDLSRLAKEHKCCILLLRHLSKGPTGRAIYRGLGSMDFTGAVRTELLAGCSSTDPTQYALVHTKSNLGQKGISLGYAIGATGFWWRGESQLTATDLLSPESSAHAGEALTEAKEFLLNALAQGARIGNEVIAEAQQAGISKVTLKRAKKKLKVLSHKSSLCGGWKWSLPEGNQTTPNTETIIPFEHSKEIKM